VGSEGWRDLLPSLLPSILSIHNKPFCLKGTEKSEETLERDFVHHQGIEHLNNVEEKEDRRMLRCNNVPGIPATPM
jgi:hypothetical protein